VNIGVKMDKKDKKKLQTIQAKIQFLKKKLAGEKRQPDDPAAIKQLEKEISELESKVAELKTE